MQAPHVPALTASAQSLFQGCRAVLFDLDGVLTPTSEVHMAAWKRLFHDVVARHADAAPYTDRDYFEHIDGRPRYDGVRAVLDSRGIALPQGAPDDPPDAETVCGLGNRKDREFRSALAADGIAPYPGSIRFLDAIDDAGMRSAVVSSSRNARLVLDAAGLADRFTVVVDGDAAARRGLAGKPAPDTYLAAAADLGVAASESVVVEDAVSGVAAGHAGGFALVLGVDRGVGRNQLLERGADVVIDDLGELVAP